MKDTPERDLAIANELSHMANARIAELERERDALKADNKALKTFLYHTAIDAHAAFHIGQSGPAFQDCKEGPCIRARAALGETK